MSVNIVGRRVVNDTLEIEWDELQSSAWAGWYRGTVVARGEKCQVVLMMTLALTESGAQIYDENGDPAYDGVLNIRPYYPHGAKDDYPLHVEAPLPDYLRPYLKQDLNINGIPCGRLEKGYTGFFAEDVLKPDGTPFPWVDGADMLYHRHDESYDHRPGTANYHEHRDAEDVGVYGPHDHDVDVHADEHAERTPEGIAIVLVCSLDVETYQAVRNSIEG